MVVDAGPDGFPHIRVHDDSLVSADYEEDVDEDDLVAPVIFYPAAQWTVKSTDLTKFTPLYHLK